jgi:hypothetical protein
MCTPAVFEERIVTARKPHKCCECGGAIPPGTQCEKASGLWDQGYGWDTIYTCIPCSELRKNLRERLGPHSYGQDDPLCYGELREACAEMRIPFPPKAEVNL